MSPAPPAFRRRFTTTLAGAAVAVTLLTACAATTSTPASPQASTTLDGTTAMIASTQFDGIYSATVSSDGAPPVAIVDGAPVGLTIQGDKITVSTGCNGGNGTVTVSEGHLSVPNLATTRKACSPELMAQEQWVIQMLTDAEVEVTDAGLTLRWGPAQSHWLTFIRATAK